MKLRSGFFFARFLYTQKCSFVYTCIHTFNRSIYISMYTLYVIKTYWIIVKESTIKNGERFLYTDIWVLGSATQYISVNKFNSAIQYYVDSNGIAQPTGNSMKLSDLFSWKSIFVKQNFKIIVWIPLLLHIFAD